MPSKQQQYNALVAKRKCCRLCTGLSNPALRGLRRYDSEQIGPWSRMHGDLNAQLMIVGQDWGAVNYYNRFRGLDDLQNPTMRNLEKLLNHIGIHACFTDYSKHHRGLFLTNAILCLKNGGLQAKVDATWFQNCGENFLRQQIEIIRPKVVVGLGKHAFHAILRAFKLPLVQLREAVEDTYGSELCDNVRLFAAYHCGARTVNINRDIKQQCKDWKRIQKALRPV